MAWYWKKAVSNNNFESNKFFFLLLNIVQGATTGNVRECKSSHHESTPKQQHMSTNEK
jgi:hypothetical protein